MQGTSNGFLDNFEATDRLNINFLHRAVTEAVVAEAVDIARWSITLDRVALDSDLESLIPRWPLPPGFCHLPLVIRVADH